MFYRTRVAYGDTQMERIRFANTRLFFLLEEFREENSFKPQALRAGRQLVFGGFGLEVLLFPSLFHLSGITQQRAPVE